MHIDQWLEAIPPLVVYLLVGVVVLIESLGIPIPGEIVLVSAALLSSRHELNVSWEWIAASGTAGAIIGDSIGYAIGHRFGRPLFVWLGRRFPSHFGPDHVAYAEHVFNRWGSLAVYFGRWIAILRIFSGPLAGALKMRYPRFLLANALGGLTWAAGTTVAIYYVGVAAETFLSRFSYIALALAVVGGLIGARVLSRKMNSLVERHAQQLKSEREATARADAAERESTTSADAAGRESTTSADAAGRGASVDVGAHAGAADATEGTTGKSSSPPAPAEQPRR